MGKQRRSRKEQRSELWILVKGSKQGRKHKKTKGGKQEKVKTTKPRVKSREQRLLEEWCKYSRERKDGQSAFSSYTCMMCDDCRNNTHLKHYTTERLYRPGKTTSKVECVLQSKHC